MLPNGTGVKSLPVGVPGGVFTEITAEAAANYPAVLEALRQLTGMCLFEPCDFSNGISAFGMDQGCQDAERAIYAAKDVLAAAGVSFAEGETGSHDDLFDRAIALAESGERA
ncbi:MAG TPA: hypothetical protein VGK45_18840 [Thermoanaerobaculia bacterium]|jgi:hypothetical protein